MMMVHNIDMSPLHTLELFEFQNLKWINPSFVFPLVEKVSFFLPLTNFHCRSPLQWGWRTCGTCWNRARKGFPFTIYSTFNFLKTPFFPSERCSTLTRVFVLLVRNKRVCVDLSCWMVQLHSVSKSHACVKEKVYLKGLFHRLRALIALNCSLVFVTGLSISVFSELGGFVFWRVKHHLVIENVWHCHILKVTFLRKVGIFF